MEKTVQFKSENLTLYGLYKNADSEKGVVITHPHPLYGGDMHNHVVDGVAKWYQNRQVNTLRFNFRGTGRSDGIFDNGRGEQEDVLAALNFLKDRGARQIDLIGYSFGAWINALVSRRKEAVFRHLILIAPPLALIRFDDLYDLKQLKLVITGAYDDIAPPDQIERFLLSCSCEPEFIILPDTDHAFSMGTDQLTDRLNHYL